MISIDAQQQLLINISRRLKRPLNVYAIGGTAMMFLGFKDLTLNIDLVFENERDRQAFEEALVEIGYKSMDSVVVYGKKENQPKMYTLGDERFDLFVMHVIDFDFSQEMRKRAEQIHQFHDNLFLKVANHHDLILMKCATDRMKDIDDARKIINDKKIDWSILISEVKIQIGLGRHTAAFDLGEFLEKLKYKMKIGIPKEVIDELYELVEKQAKEKISS